MTTFAIDRRAVELTGKQHPRAIYIPYAAPHKAEDDYEAFQRMYEQELGCETALLSAFEPVRDLLTYDLIYIGGGSTLALRDELLQTGADQVLRQAHAQGIVLAGFSAGSNWLFTESLSYEGGLGTIRVEGLGLINAFHCAHFNYESRANQYFHLLHENEIGVALDDNCALEVVNGHYRILTSQAGAGAYQVRKVKGEIERKMIVQQPQSRPLNELLRW